MGKGAGKRIPVNIPSVAGPVNIDTGMLVSVSRSDGHDITTYVLCVSMWYSRELRERRPRLFWCSICTDKIGKPSQAPVMAYLSWAGNQFSLGLADENTGPAAARSGALERGADNRRL